MNTFLHACQWISTSYPQARGITYHDTQEQAEAAMPSGAFESVVFVQPVEESR